MQQVFWVHLRVFLLNIYIQFRVTKPCDAKLLVKLSESDVVAMEFMYRKHCRTRIHTKCKKVVAEERQQEQNRHCPDGKY